MPQDLQTTVNSLRDTVAERIKEQFTTLIPDEQWQELVAREITWFTKTKDGGYRQSQDSSPLQDLIRKELNTLGKEAIKKALGDNKWLGKFGPNGEQMASEMVLKMVRENAAEMTAQIFGRVIQDAVERAKFAS